MTKRQLRILVSVVGGAVIWEIGARYLVENSLVIVPVSQVWHAFVRLAASGKLALHVSVSLTEFLGGFAIAAAVGISLGILMALSPTLRDLADPWVNGLNSTPVVAISPLLIIAFGIGIASKVAVVFLVAVFPILINTLAGADSAEATLIEATRVFGANRRQIFQKVVLPSALPYIIAGLRLGLARGLVGIVVGEMFGAQAGVGHLIMISGEVFATADLYVGVIMLAAAGIIFMEGLGWLELRLAPWRVNALDDMKTWEARHG